MKTLIRKLLNRKTLLTFTFNVRSSVAEIRRHVLDGFKLVICGAVAVLTKWVKV